MAPTPQVPRKPWSREPRGTSTASALRAGLLFGVLSGGVFLLAVLAAAAVGRMSVLEPLRHAASVVLGSGALTGGPPLLVGVAGLAVHFAVSAFFGVTYGFIDSTLAPDDRPRALHQMALGALFGVGVWLVNIQFLARRFFPWFLALPQFPALVLHALAFGIPLGWLFAEGERRHRLLGASRAADAPSPPRP